jgi:hypothetical protein
MIVTDAPVYVVLTYTASAIKQISEFSEGSAVFPFPALEPPLSLRKFPERSDLKSVLVIIGSQGMFNHNSHITDKGALSVKPT